MADLKDGYKADEGKAPWGLVPWDAVGGIVKVLQFGAKKYAPRNWEKGMDWNRPYEALMRHMTDWWMGQDKDPETGYSHLWHAGCCIFFLIAYEIRGIGTDNRPNVDKVPFSPAGPSPQMQRVMADLAQETANRVLTNADPVPVQRGNTITFEKGGTFMTGKDVFKPWNYKVTDYDRS